MTQCIERIKQAIDDANAIYEKNLALVLDFFTSKLHLYYSSSRLTLLLTFLSTSGSNYLRTYLIPLPSRLKNIDEDALDLHTASGWHADKCYWQTFQDFLHSKDPLALDGGKYAVAAFACLKILFGPYQPPISCIMWFSQHSQALRERMNHHSPWHHRALQLKSVRRCLTFYCHLRTHPCDLMPPKRFLLESFLRLEDERRYQFRRSDHLLFLLPKSAYSHDILNFARSRVFRFGYLYRKHPTYMKKVIFSLAKYIARVTGETAKVRACESIWGREAWFTAQ